MKRIFFIPPILFFAVVFFAYAVLPQWFSFRHIKTEALQKEQELQNRKEYFDGLAKDLAEFSGFQDSLQKIDTALPGEPEVAPLISFFNEKAVRNGLVLKAVAESQVSAMDSEINSDEIKKIQKIPAAYFTISLVGQVSAFEAFLRDIETSARLVEVQNIALQQQNEAVPSDINLFIKVYY